SLPRLGSLDGAGPSVPFSGSDMTAPESCDLLVIGGGINGVAIAREAALRGLSVVLVEQDDLAAATSSASSKLAHGGLRYLEQGAFGLVRQSLNERSALLAAAPHIVRPLRFVLPHDSDLRPAWRLRLGLLLYDLLSGAPTTLSPFSRVPPPLPASAGLDLSAAPEGAPLKAGLRRAFTYSDAWVEDSRLTVLTAMDAARMGARILTRSRCVSARPDQADPRTWRITLAANGPGGVSAEVAARGLINVAGPWVSQVEQQVIAGGEALPVRLVRGSHIVVPRLHHGDHAYILQAADRHIVFVLPYERDFSLIGTTDAPLTSLPDTIEASGEEIAYLLNVVGRWFRQPPTRDQVVATFAGIRALADDGRAEARAVTREYALHLAPSVPPRLSVVGGKLTTHRHLARQALDRMAPRIGQVRGPVTTLRRSLLSNAVIALRPVATPVLPARQTVHALEFDHAAAATLPGGDLPAGGVDDIAATLRTRVADMPAALADRLAGTYGTLSLDLTAGCSALADLGPDLGGGMSPVELRWLRAHEWARTAEDVLWRRTRLGLTAPSGTAERITRWFAQQPT
ncbi:MAG: glycerol-3-phosphate dehydrogenase, partial [Alphaproteobacteria bacterium]